MSCVHLLLVEYTNVGVLQYWKVAMFRELYASIDQYPEYLKIVDSVLLNTGNI